MTSTSRPQRRGSCRSSRGRPWAARLSPQTRQLMPRSTDPRIHRKKVEDSSPDRIIWRRVLQGFFVECYETAAGLLQAKSYALAVANLQIAAEVRPDSRGVFYNLACCYSRLREKRKALDALKKEIENGYGDLRSLETDPDLDAIRSDPEFGRLLADLVRKKQM